MYRARKITVAYARLRALRGKVRFTRTLAQLKADR
jgi:hypothetical protein